MQSQKLYIGRKFGETQSLDLALKAGYYSFLSPRIGHLATLSPASSIGGY